MKKLPTTITLTYTCYDEIEINVQELTKKNPDFAPFLRAWMKDDLHRTEKDNALLNKYEMADWISIVNGHEPQCYADVEVFSTEYN